MTEQAHARHDDPETSHDAAASVSDIRYRQQAVYYLLLVTGPSTDEELVSAYAERGNLPRQAPSGIRTRRNELVRAGLVRWTGTRKAMTTGRRGRVWEAVA